MLLPLFDPSRPPERYFLRAIQANPNAGEMLGTYAVFLEQQGRCEEAERFYRRAIDAEPHHVSSLRSYALFLSRQGRSEEAEAYYQQAIQSGPERASTLQDYALFLQSQGRFADAEAIYNSAMEELLGPKHSWHRLEWEAMKARRSLNLVIVAMARAADEDQLHRLLLLAVTAGECLGFSRAILFLKRENNEVFDAVVAVGPVDLDAAMRQWSEAKGMPLAEMIERCARPPSPPRPGDLQKSIDELSLDARQPELLSKLGAGSIVVRRRGAPPLLRDLPGWPTTVNSDAEDSEYVFAPLEVSGTLYGAIYADRSFIATSVIPQYTLDLLEVLIREFALSLAALRQRREEAEAKAAKELARGISHGLATRVRILEAELALLKGELSGQHADAIARMEKSIAFFKRTSKLSAGLLGVKRLGLEKGGPCDLNEVVAEMVALLADARIEFRRSPSRLIVRADRARIEEILTELLVNARDFVDPETGRISVETGIAGRTARVEIRDNGPGIHPALRPHLFRSFSSYPTSRRGLGLSYAKTLAEGYGGTITEIGQWGQGARFVTEIPLAELPAPVLCDVIIDELEHDPALSLSESKARQLAEQLRPVLANAEVAAAQQDDIDKQVALIAAHLARGMPDNDVSRLLVGRLCARLLTQTGLQLRLSPAHVNELYELAVADDPRTPDNVLIWIRNHAKLIARGIDDAVPIRATDRR
jgi:signal transduction histidine kinase